MMTGIQVLSSLSQFYQFNPVSFYAAGRVFIRIVSLFKTVMTTKNIIFVVFIDKMLWV